MVYNHEHLQEVENFAYLYLTKVETALITGVDSIDLNDPEHELYRAFQKGRLRRKAEFNGAVIKLTNQHSSPAMAIEQKIAEAAALNDLIS
jgi:hypothetical protein